MGNVEQETKKMEDAIARRIRELRKDRGWTLGKLAEITGLSKSYLSQIENREKTPTIGTLTKIAYALGENVQSFWKIEKDDDEVKMTMVRSSERRSIIHPGATSGYSYESISFKKPDRIMDAYIVTLEPGMTKEPMIHEGQEMVYMLEGRKEFIYDGKSYIAQKGDCLCFDSDRPHLGRSLDGKPARMLVVFVNPRRQD
jgi:transcriptional regulator with XRE-family HTH domain